MVAPILATLLTACSPPGHAIVTEVYYDAPGDDTGHEFVELLNPGPMDVPLAGVRLEAGDGSGPARWTLRWTGSAGQTLAPGERFVVGGALVSPLPDAIVTLDLQNGPDAVRLVWPDGAREVVGWGTHEFAEYACGTPAPDVPGGQSLARIPDDSDAGTNRLDFRAASPSPGRANQAARDLGIVAGSLAASVPRPEAGEPFALRATLQNAGRDTLGAGVARLEVRCDAWSDPLVAVLADALEPGDSLAATVVATLPAGRWALEARAAAPGDAVAANDTDSLRLRVGGAPLLVTEIQFHPAHGEGEWVEARNASGGPLAIDGWTLAERSGTRGAIHSAGTLPADSLVVFAQDRPALLARHAGLDTTRLIAVSPWGALNNSDDPEGIADVLTLREWDGTFVDAVPYHAGGVPPGAAIARDDALWRTSSPPEGTPLAPLMPLPAIAGRFELLQPRLPPGKAAPFSWRLPWERPRVTLDLYDLAGRRVRRLLDDIAVAPRDVRLVPLAALPAGLYVAVLQARESGGRERLALSAALRVSAAGR